MPDPASGLALVAAIALGLEKTVQRLRADLGPEGCRLSTTRAGYQLACG